MIWQTSSTSSGDTERLAELLGRRLKGGEVIELRSDLGGGKTTFVRGMVSGAGSHDRVSSPTFTLSRIYRAPKFDIHHFDFYRLDDPGILSDQLAEAIADGNVVVVEWADVVKEVLPPERISIEFKPVAGGPDLRDIAVTYPESRRGVISFVQSGYTEERP